MCYMSVPTFIHVCVTQLEAHTVECLKVALSSHFATPTSETYIRCQFSPVLRRVQSFMTFRACFSPSKMRLGLEKKNKNNNNNNNNNRADSIGSSHHRCSVPNN